MDESGLSGSQGCTRILCKKGMKNPSRLTGNNEKVMFTVFINLKPCGMIGLKMAQNIVNTHVRHLVGWNLKYLLTGSNFSLNVLIVEVIHK